ncbi:uncharacterized protein LY89DRAFT_756189 [Mollisia scopiformis]|uniref:Uncharacterized protein n=1 Tax=Mollisia scopiformis TaxID=149040 RepID=A0A194WYC9_MOLSC|nr:uncharacterized protein LY89DRAFT_756189 [Mollisia scopiformis]KUJ12945.1 hypothetical protein LY89DRAFT_756189 [Mollisia scopiformis]
MLSTRQFFTSKPFPWPCAVEQAPFTNYLTGISLRQTDLSRSKIRDCAITDCSITGHTLAPIILEDCLIENSNIDACELINCVIKDSKVNESDMKRCTIYQNSRVTQSTMDQSLMLNSSAQRVHCENSYFYESELIKCKMVVCKLNNTHAVGIEAKSSLLRFCNIAGSRAKFTRSTLDDCKVCAKDSTVVESRTLSHPLALYKFPPEIRNLIYEYAIDGKGRGSPLIAALRGEPKLYHEALAVLNRTCVFDADKDILRKASSVLRTARPDEHADVLGQVRHTIIGADLLFVLATITFVLNEYKVLESIHINEWDYMQHGRANEDGHSDLLRFCKKLFRAKNLSMKKLTITFGSVLDLPFKTDTRDALMKAVNRDLENMLGVQGKKMQTEGASDEFTPKTTWTWTATPGTKLWLAMEDVDSTFKKFAESESESNAMDEDE